jgi:2,4-dienoyl-CoA reductase-like NADH-dependent reductase (Old Yellow Enzyme family)/thioredoxin reductase
VFGYKSVIVLKKAVVSSQKNISIHYRKEEHDMKKEELDKKHGVSRRDFLKTAAAGSVGIATIGLAGCQPKTVSTPVAATGEAAKTTGQAAEKCITARTAAANLNPQDYDYTSNTSDLSTLFSPWKLGPLTISNRMVKSAAGSDTWVKEFGQEVIAYYTNFAKGGIEMVWVENFANLLTKYPVPNKKDLSTYPVAKLVDAVHAAGAHIGYQFDTMGATIGTVANDGSFKQATAIDLKKEDIKSFQDDIIAGAKILHDAGFDAFEINAAGNNIGQSFFSRLRNLRDDEYGPQSFENRARFVVEIIQGIKKACGDDFIVQVLINGIEENDANLGDSSLLTTVEENKGIAKMLEAAGANSLHVRLGPPGMHVAEFASDLYFTGRGIEGTTGYGTQFDFSRHWEGMLIGNHSGCGMMLNVAKEIKSAVSIPVGTVTYMDPAHAPDFFEKALKDGMVDFLIMNRPLTVDPDYVKKLKEHRIDEIAPCTRCMHCHFDYDKDGKVYEHCRVNACTQRAYRDAMPEGYDPLPAKGDKKIMVIGGGPAGMEAARIAAQRGYKVTLYEKKNKVGGLLSFADMVKGPHENLESLRAYLERQLQLKGVTVVTNKEVDASFITAQAPDVVILATGGLRDTLGFKDTAGTKIMPIENVMSSDIGENVTIVGGNAQAIDSALYLMSQDKHVTIVSPDPIATLDKGQSNWVKTFVLPMLYSHGTRVWPKAKITSVGNGEITIKGETGVDMVVKCDTVIEAMDMLPNTNLLNGITGMETYAIGDCKEPWNMAEAITAGNLVARKI